MNSVFVYCEIEDGQVAEVSMELLTKGAPPSSSSAP
jgi:electron transfer flavoprotein alpha subunit